jgi:hypothetical protein
MRKNNRRAIYPVHPLAVKGRRLSLGRGIEHLLSDLPVLSETLLLVD